jgi:hypothetical protein
MYLEVVMEETKFSILFASPFVQKHSNLTQQFQTVTSSVSKFFILKCIEVVNLEHHQLKDINKVLIIALKTVI